jgi:hypothetical protein
MTSSAVSASSAGQLGLRRHVLEAVQFALELGAEDLAVAGEGGLALVAEIEIDADAGHGGLRWLGTGIRC